MSIPSKINKENLRLLDLSSDEESEDLQLEIIPNRKKKITRKERNRHVTQKTPEPNIGTEVQCALCWAVRGTLLLWLLMLTWICASLYDQVSTMKIDVNKVNGIYGVSRHNRSFEMAEVKKLILESILSYVTTDKLQEHISHTIKEEYKMCTLDDLIDTVSDSPIVHVNDDNIRIKDD